jgi:hypothetical protein
MRRRASFFNIEMITALIACTAAGIVLRFMS